MKAHPPGAVSGLSLGILSLMGWWVPVLGLVLGLMSMWNAHRAGQFLARHPEDFRDDGLPTSGMVCGIIGASISLLWNIAIFGFLLLVAASLASITAQPDAPTYVPQL